MWELSAELVVITVEELEGGEPMQFIPSWFLGPLQMGLFHSDGEQ